MKLLRRFVKRLMGQRDEERLREEVEEHIALLTAEYVRDGMTATEARRQAVLKFGAVEAIKEDYRDQRSLPFLEALSQDVRYSLRRLRKTPGFTIVAVLTLALGIGATTSIFTLVHAVLLKSLPVSRPEQLYRLGKDPHCCVNIGFIRSQEYGIVSNALYEYLRDHTNGFEELAAFDAGGVFLGVRRASGADAAETYFGEFVSGNYFAMFGVNAYAGRALSKSDDKSNAAPVAMMSYRVWEQKHGLDPTVIGSVFNINGKAFTIAGITPPGFYGHGLSNLPPDFYLPLATEPLVKGDSSLLNKADTHWLNVIGRVRTKANAGSIEAQMRVELQQWLRSHWGEMDAGERLAVPKQTLNLGPGGAGITGMRQQYGSWLRILMMVAGFVLLIVCANVANLMLLRGMEGRRQTSLSMALGARPARILRQALTESILLSLAGGLAGLAVAFAGTRLILHFAFETTTAVPISAAPSWPVVVFAFALASITGVLFGMAPAWLATQVDPMEALRGANRSTREAGTRPRRILVVLQAALSVVLLSSAGLLLEALRNLEHQDLGFAQERRTVIGIDPVLAGYQPGQLEPLYGRIQTSLAALPGVASVACALYSPQSGDDWGEGISVAGQPLPGPDVDSAAGWSRVTSEFFQTIGMPIVQGRPLAVQDTARSRHVAVINEAFARKFFRNEDPIGKHFGKTTNSAADYEIVGVAKDARFANYNLDRPIPAFFFLPETQSTLYQEAGAASTELRSHYLHDVVIALRPGANLPEALVRRALGSVDPNLPVMRIESLKEQVARTFSQQRLIARLTSLFGVLALVLAAIGLYGVTAYNAGSRTSEIGVRMALGADRGDVVTLILRGALLLIAFGLALGVPLALAAGRLLGSQLYGINPYDPTVLVASMIVLGSATLVAALLPALRASSISPLQALRAE